MGKQSLHETAPDSSQQFKHNLSIASTSRSETQRREAMSFLTSHLSSAPYPVGTQTILDKLLPLISDSSSAVRSQLLKLFRSLPEAQVRHHVERAIMYIRAGMTHLSKDVNNDALSFLEWLLDAAADDLVSCPGGWVKPIKSFCAMLGWNATGNSSWTSAPSTSLRAKDMQAYARQISMLSRFLHAGLKIETPLPRNPNAYWEQLTRLPRQPNPFAYLNLFGPRRDEDGEMYIDREARQRVFGQQFLEVVSLRADRTKKEGGAPGRAAAALDQVLQEGMTGYEPSDDVDLQDLKNLL